MISYVKNNFSNNFFHFFKECVYDNEKTLLDPEKLFKNYKVAYERGIQEVPEDQDQDDVLWFACYVMSSIEKLETLPNKVQVIFSNSYVIG